MAADRPVALITGAARRVGARIARLLHARGFDLALHHRNSSEDMAALVADLEAGRADSCLVLQAELGEFDRLPELVAHTLGRFGRLDALVNNASAFYPTPVGGITPQHWDELFASNARAPLFLSQAAAPHLQSTGGAIVNLVDIYAERPLARHPVYCMAKAALLAMTRSLAIELGPEVRVNAVAPGAVMWPESGKAYTDQQKLIDATALKRVGSPDDVAEAVRWLIQDGRYCTGEVIRVDGGRSLQI
ncbi:pteridine reductase [Pseudomarimonas salicorniae]|uniref:Pteridine reductase n=1 Tax=Pseudomarimonas salicorniae TaxID=2933270 RepID=A0ABT0GFS7_9GAMM|nr:pteridine reductase [Lysobacter sp. CAU 1642]MCK7593386.1 pteridine reductase [Lysobacter sp. CAU 1642]